MVKPLVSVIIPTKDRAEDLARALASVGSQTHAPLEAVVIDDGSSTDLGPVFAKFRLNYPSIALRVHRNAEPRGGGSCRNLGTTLAAGELVCFLDDDDLYLPEKIELLAGYLAQHQDVDAVFGRVIIRDTVDTLIDYGQYRQRLTRTAAIARLQTNGSLVRREVLTRANFHPPLRKFQDTQFHLELCRRVNVHLVETPVAVWHRSYSSTQVSHIGLSDGVTVLAHFDALRAYLVSTGALQEADHRFLRKQRLKYLAKLAPYRDGVSGASAESPAALLIFNLYWVYYRLSLWRKGRDR
ncbi:MAG TPA: glycosyltransferase family 2 protein [Stenotrophomonas sp.]|jgi:glycosyltransferase involved in cell wall biosynthesis